MTLPEKTSRPGAKKGRPRTVNEDVTPTDQPLYRVVPDKRLQRDALLWVSLGLIASLAAVCVVAIATGSVPTALVSATGILAAALLLIVRHVFPRRTRAA